MKNYTIRLDTLNENSEGIQLKAKKLDKYGIFIFSVLIFLLGLVSLLSENTRSSFSLTLLIFLVIVQVAIFLPVMVYSFCEILPNSGNIELLKSGVQIWRFGRPQFYRWDEIDEFDMVIRPTLSMLIQIKKTATRKRIPFSSYTYALPSDKLAHLLNELKKKQVVVLDEQYFTVRDFSLGNIAFVCMMSFFCWYLLTCIYLTLFPFNLKFKNLSGHTIQKVQIFVQANKATSSSYQISPFKRGGEENINFKNLKHSVLKVFYTDSYGETRCALLKKRYCDFKIQDQIIFSRDNGIWGSPSRCVTGKNKSIKDEVFVHSCTSS